MWDVCPMSVSGQLPAGLMTLPKGDEAWLMRHHMTITRDWPTVMQVLASWSVRPHVTG